MKLSDQREAARVLAVASGLLIIAAGPQAISATGADLRQACGVLSARAMNLVKGATFGTPLFTAFEAARKAGGSFDAFDRVRATVTGLTGPKIWGLVRQLTPFSDGSTFSDGTMWAEAPEVSDEPLGYTDLAKITVVVQQACIRMALVEQAQVLAATTFKSRAEIDAYMARMHAAFGPAETFAADQGDADAYRSLVALHASVTQDLATRARPLPRIVTYTLPTRRPALFLANRLYGDASRTDELIAENRPVHPLFMPPSGRALS